MKDIKAQLLKGCGRCFLYIASLNDRRMCGQVEDLKHSDNILLCPECKATLSGIEQGEKLRQMLLIEYTLSEVDKILNIFAKVFKEAGE